MRPGSPTEQAGQSLAPLCPASPLRTWPAPGPHLARFCSPSCFPTLDKHKTTSWYRGSKLGGRGHGGGEGLLAARSSGE